MAKWEPVFKIDGVIVPKPDNYQQVISDLSSEETGRTLDGVAHKDVIAIKCSVPLEWYYLEWSVAAKIARLVDGKQSISVEYMDIRNPYTMTRANIYVGDRECSTESFTTDGKVYWSLKFNEIDI